MTLNESTILGGKTKEDFLRDKRSVSTALLTNLLGFLGLRNHAGNSTKLNSFFKRDSVRLDAVTVDSNDLLFSIKLAVEADLLTTAQGNSLTKMLALIKQGKVDKVDEALLRTNLSSFSKLGIMCDATFKPFYVKFLKGEHTLADTVVAAYKYSKKNGVNDELQAIAKVLVSSIDDDQSVAGGAQSDATKTAAALVANVEDNHAAPVAKVEPPKVDNDPLSSTCTWPRDSEALLAYRLWMMPEEYVHEEFSKWDSQYSLGNMVMFGSSMHGAFESLTLSSPAFKRINNQLASLPQLDSPVYFDWSTVERFGRLFLDSAVYFWMKSKHMKMFFDPSDDKYLKMLFERLDYSYNRYSFTSPVDYPEVSKKIRESLKSGEPFLRKLYSVLDNAPIYSSVDKGMLKGISAIVFERPASRILWYMLKNTSPASFAAAFGMEPTEIAKLLYELDPSALKAFYKQFELYHVVSWRSAIKSIGLLGKPGFDMGTMMTDFDQVPLSAEWVYKALRGVLSDEGTVRAEFQPLQKEIEANGGSLLSLATVRGEESSVKEGIDKFLAEYFKDFINLTDNFMGTTLFDMPFGIGTREFFTDYYLGHFVKNKRLTTNLDYKMTEFQDKDLSSKLKAVMKKYEWLRPELTKFFGDNLDTLKLLNDRLDGYGALARINTILNFLTDRTGEVIAKFLTAEKMETRRYMLRVITKAHVDDPTVRKAVQECMPIERLLGQLGINLKVVPFVKGDEKLKEIEDLAATEKSFKVTLRQVYDAQQRLDTIPRWWLEFLIPLLGFDDLTYDMQTKMIANAFENRIDSNDPLIDRYFENLKKMEMAEQCRMYSSFVNTVIQLASKNNRMTRDEISALLNGFMKKQLAGGTATDIIGSSLEKVLLNHSELLNTESCYSIVNVVAFDLKRKMIRQSGIDAWIGPIATKLFQDETGSPSGRELFKRAFSTMTPDDQNFVRKKMRDQLIIAPMVEGIFGGNELIKPEIHLSENDLKKVLSFNSFSFSKGLSLKKNESLEDYFDRAKARADVATLGDQLKPKVTKKEIADSTEYEKMSAELLKFYSEPPKHGNVALKITDVFDVNLTFPEFDDFKAKFPNTRMEPVFHGTGTVAASMILRFGFRVINCSDNCPVKTAGKMLGNGIYFSTVVDKAAQYVGDNASGGGVSRHGQKGYFLEMEAFTGETPANFKAAGLGRDGIRSPEWCVFDARAQLRIVKAYRVEMVPRTVVAQWAAKHGIDTKIKTESTYFPRFANFYREQLLREEVGQLEAPIVSSGAAPEPWNSRNSIVYFFMDGKIPVSKNEWVTFDEFEEKYESENVVLSSSPYGACVEIRTDAEVHGHQVCPSVYWFAQDIDGCFSQYLTLFERARK